MPFVAFILEQASPLELIELFSREQSVSRILLQDRYCVFRILFQDGEDLPQIYFVNQNHFCHSKEDFVNQKIGKGKSNVLSLTFRQI